ncbi:MAG: hypothetical protein VKK42_23690 [Lyngbya sp.]|nr:hypothetical protein [Lyngbya sp.]
MKSAVRSLKLRPSPLIQESPSNLGNLYSPGRMRSPGILGTGEQLPA